MSKARVLIVRAPGTNCDRETAYAFELAGAEAELVHVNRLIGGERKLADYNIMVIPGGFTYGDDIAGGKVLANELKLKLGGDISAFVTSGGLILGICNGFQVMVKMGILPEPLMDATPQLTLTANDSGRFECRWVHLSVNKASRCVFTEGIDQMYLPVAHGEGKLVTGLEMLLESNIALRYTDAEGNTGAGYPHNPNGSDNDIAGLCDSSGRVFALMPHPERHVRGTQHPQWTRRGAREYGDGFRIFQNAVKWAAGN
jgi:phosphoribosylformylglycinamidine synthase